MMVGGMVRICAILLVFALVLCSSCGGGDGTTKTNFAVRHFRSLLFNLTTPKAMYAKRENVPLHFTVTNVGPHTVTMGVDACEAIYLVSSGTQPVSGVFCAVPEGFTLTFAPGET